MSGGYLKYLRSVIPRMAKHQVVDTILSAMPESLNVQGWFNPMPNVRFVSCKPFRFLFSRCDAELWRELERFSPDVIFIPVERNFRFNSVPVVNMIQNMEPLVANIQGDPLIEKLKKYILRFAAKHAIKKPIG